LKGTLYRFGSRRTTQHTQPRLPSGWNFSFILEAPVSAPVWMTEKPTDESRGYDNPG